MYTFTISHKFKHTGLVEAWDSFQQISNTSHFLLIQSVKESEQVNTEEVENWEVLFSKSLHP